MELTRGDKVWGCNVCLRPVLTIDGVCDECRARARELTQQPQVESERARAERWKKRALLLRNALRQARQKQS
jgi:hypothetical protein